VGKALRLWRINKENQQLRFRIDDLLRTAGAFQRSLFSQAIPESRTVRFSVSFNPHEEYHCGGDFYDILQDDAGAYMIILGDVTGHGPKPAMIAGMVKTAIHSIIDSDKSLRSAPDRLLKRLNDQFCAMFACSPETLIALSAVHLSPARQILAVATAGLPAVIHLRNAQPEVLRTPNHILGAFPDTEFYKIERFLQPGDHIILYTDGLVESIPTFFTVEPDAVTAALAEMTDYSAQAISDFFLAKLPGATFTDDVTVLSLEILPGKS
jgi:sigma-B regulation protein RsbU (phosphoserine phosphatase)